MSIQINRRHDLKTIGIHSRMMSQFTSFHFFKLLGDSGVIGKPFYFTAHHITLKDRLEFGLGSHFNYSHSGMMSYSNASFHSFHMTSHLGLGLEIGSRFNCSHTKFSYRSFGFLRFLLNRCLSHTSLRACLVPNERQYFYIRISCTKKS